jgi:glycosyltransferase involved in cell wall biosynthesis
MRRAGLPAAKLVAGSNFVSDPGERGRPPSAGDEVLFVGRISAEKGLGVLLDAWRRFAPAGIRLVVAGDGPLRAELSATAPAGVEFLGRIAPVEVVARLRRARALVIPSIWYEGQPLTALEGMAAGTPLVLSQVGGLAEVLGGTRSGWTTPPGDVERLAATLRELNDGAAVDARGDQARRRYLAAYTPGVAVERLESVYQSVCTGARAEAPAR